MTAPEMIYAQTAPKNIDMLNKIIEAYGHLGVVSTINHESGLVVIRVTRDTHSEVMEILSYLPFSLKVGHF